MSQVIPGTYGTCGLWDKAMQLTFTWDIPDVPGNPRYTWDIWEMGQGCEAESYLGHSRMSQVIPGTYGTSGSWDKAMQLTFTWGIPGCPRYTWDVWDVGQAYEAGF